MFHVKHSSRGVSQKSKNMANIFQKIPISSPKSNSFDLSYDLKLSLDMGQLVPIHVQECIPGDIFTQKTETLLRFAPLIAPVMHRVKVYQHFFFVPNRILWPGWEKWIIQEPGAGAYPVMNDMTVQAKSLSDYLGLPIGPFSDANVRPSALPFAAYQRIWYDYYRDQNLEDSANNGYKGILVDGVQPTMDSGVLQTLRVRAWSKDMFTSALPWPQKGAEAVIPIGQLSGKAPVYRSSGGGGTTSLTSSPSGAFVSNRVVPDTGDGQLAIDVQGPGSTIQVGSSSINDLRRAFRLQEWLEKKARGGTRYIEMIASMFGVKSSDARLNRPEFLGGSVEPVVISEVLQNAPPTNTGATPQGNMAGHGISVGAGKQVRYRVEEHGFIIGIMSVLPVTAYQQGTPRLYLKNDPFLYYWPDFAHIGEQAIFSEELWHENSAAARGTFGYTPRYAEYRYNPSRVAGDFRTNLSYWHMGRIFDSKPALNAQFVRSNPTKRIFAVTSEDVNSLYAHVFHRIKARRPIPKFGVPSF